MTFRVAPQAESDLDEIWFFLSTQSSSIVPDRLIDSITGRFAPYDKAIWTPGIVA